MYCTHRGPSLQAQVLQWHNLLVSGGVYTLLNPMHIHLPLDLAFALDFPFARASALPTVRFLYVSMATLPKTPEP